MKKRILASMLIILVTINILALEPHDITTGSGIVITPMLVIGAKNDTNIFSASIDEVESIIYTVIPTVNFLMQDGVNQYIFDLGVESGTFESSSDDNYLNYNFSFTSHIEPSSQSRWDLSADFRSNTEPRGTGLTENASVAKPLTFDTQTAAATYEYGAQSTSGKLAFDINYFNKSYSILDELTISKNYASLLAGATFFYSTNSKTDAFIESNQNRIRYDVLDSSGISRDSNDVKFLVGVRWEASALTSGNFKIGRQNKSFLDSGREDFDGLSWDLGIELKPLSYSTVTFNSTRNAKDPNVEGDYIYETALNFSWQHDWSDKLYTSITFSDTKEDYSGVTVTRVDDSQNIDVSFNYSVLRWFDVSLFFQYLDKESTRSDILFDKTIAGINFSVSM